MNDWFNIFNLSVPTTGSLFTKRAFVFDNETHERQNDLNAKVYDVMTNIQATGKQARLPFQNGIMQNCIALERMSPSRSDWSQRIIYHDVPGKPKLFRKISGVHAE